MVVSVCGLLLYPQLRAKFELHYKDTETNERRRKKCPSIDGQ